MANSTLKESIIRIWEFEIKEEFTKGLLTYERQLQASLYFHLRNKLGPKYTIWIEPVVTFEEFKVIKKKPDVVITNDKEVCCIMELKFLPWSFIPYKDDLEKLETFQKVAKGKESIILAWKPISSIWKKQNSNEESKRRYSISQDLMTVMISVGRPESDAFRISQKDVSGNFLQLIGFIDDSSSGSIFKVNKLAKS